MTDSPTQGGAIRHALRIGGTLLAILAVVYVGRQLLRDDNMASVSTALVGRSSELILAACIYASVSVLLCIGWGLIVRANGIHLPLFRAGQLYARTHLYRYLPSNVLHFVSRHGALYTAGASHRAALLVNGLEIALQAFAALLLAAVLWPLIAPVYVSSTSGLTPTLDQVPTFVQTLIEWPLLEPVQASGVMVLMALFAVVVLVWLLGRKHLAKPLPLLLSFLLFVVFFIGAGVSASLLTPITDATQLIVVACAIAWLVGAVVPGASAGLGVREAMLVSVLSGPFGQQEALVLALGYRLVTLGGDVLLSLAGWLSARIPDPLDTKEKVKQHGK